MNKIKECNHKWEEDKRFKGQITTFFDKEGKKIEEIYVLCKKCGISRCMPLKLLKKNKK